MSSAIMQSSGALDATDPNAGGGVVALLDLPVGTSIAIDGHALILRRNDFVGFSHVPSSDESSAFHLVTVRAGTSDGDQEKKQSSWITVGFVIVPSSRNWILARRYDPHTEEVSSVPVDKATESNLLQTIRDGRMEPQRVISYHRILPPSEVRSWKDQTNFISSWLLHKRGLESGDKIVPGSYTEDQNGTAQKPVDASQVVVDGVSVSYPPIPVLDTSTSMHKTRHAGTKQYLAQLSPSDRTALFVGTNPANRVLQDVLQRYYNQDWKNLLGDIQLSYLLFLHLQCLSSMEHWRDLVSMMSLVSNDHVSQLPDLYAGLLQVLLHQLASMDNEFFEDVEYSGDNFFVPAIRRLCTTCSQVSNDNIQNRLSLFETAVLNRFPMMLADSYVTDSIEALPTEQADESEQQIMQISNDDDATGMEQTMDEESEGDDDDDDDDGPVVVAGEDVQASLARSSAEPRVKSGLPQQEYPERHRQSYPLLFGSIMPQEDVLMACARILDDASDVSLVREAAAYLQEVESKKL